MDDEGRASPAKRPAQMLQGEEHGLFAGPDRRGKFQGCCRLFQKGQGLLKRPGKGLFPGGRDGSGFWAHGLGHFPMGAQARYFTMSFAVA